MTRIFGVKKSKNELSKKNSMSSRAFFLRFPVLYNFLLKEITIAAEKLQTPVSSSELQGKNCFNPAVENSIFPILMILAKLQPPTSSESDDNHKISSFLPPLLLCSSSAIYKVRELASKAYVTLSYSQYGIETSFTEIIHRLSSILLQVMRHVNSKMEIEDHNYFHGFLLMAKHLLLTYRQNSVEAKKIRDEHFMDSYEKAMKILCDILYLESSDRSRKSTNHAGCKIIQATALQILNYLVSLYDHHQSNADTFKIFKKVQSAINELWQRESPFHTISTSSAIKVPGYKNLMEQLIQLYLLLNENIKREGSSERSCNSTTTIMNNSDTSIQLNRLIDVKNIDGK